MNCLVSPSRLIRLNYDLCFILLNTGDQTESKKELWRVLAEFASGGFPADDGLIRSTFSGIRDYLVLDAVSISRCDRHVWSVSIFVYYDGGIILIDSVDWGLSILIGKREPIVVTSNQQHELDQIVSHYEKQAARARLTSALTPSSPVNVIASSARFYDSLMFSFAIDQYLAKGIQHREITLLLVRGMYYRDFDAYKNIQGISVTEVEGGSLRSLMENPYIDKVLCIRLPYDNWRDVYRERFMEYVQARAQSFERRPRREDRFQVFISIELEKRRWLEQEKGLSMLLKHLYQEVGPLTVLVNGLTAPFGVGLPATYDTLRLVEQELVKNVAESLNTPDIEFRSLFGRSLQQKIADINGSDFFFAPLGSACVVPAYLGVQGLAYGTSDFVRDNRWLFSGLERVKIIDPKLVLRVEDDLSIMKFSWARAGSSGDSYSLDPAIAVQEAIACVRQKHHSRWLESRQ